MIIIGTNKHTKCNSNHHHITTHKLLHFSGLAGTPTVRPETCESIFEYTKIYIY
jgi:hypothetical protein